MTVAILALQGAFVEHEKMLQKLGVNTFEVRKLSDWNRPKDGLIIPGGESTVMLKLLHELNLFNIIKSDIQHGLPVFGTCAGLILLSKNVDNPCSKFELLGTMDIFTCRNAYGRQLGSFYVEKEFMGIDTPIPMTFIRAPYINKVGKDVEVLAEVDGHIVAARQKNQIVTAFHPELNTDTHVHKLFLDIIAAQ